MRCTRLILYAYAVCTVHNTNALISNCAVLRATSLNCRWFDSSCCLVVLLSAVLRGVQRSEEKMWCTVLFCTVLVQGGGEDEADDRHAAAARRREGGWDRTQARRYRCAASRPHPQPQPPPRLHCSSAPPIASPNATPRLGVPCRIHFLLIVIVFVIRVPLATPELSWSWLTSSFSASLLDRLLVAHSAVYSTLITQMFRRRGPEGRWGVAHRVGDEDPRKGVAAQNRRNWRSGSVHSARIDQFEFTPLHWMMPLFLFSNNSVFR